MHACLLLEENISVPTNRKVQDTSRRSVADLTANGVIQRCVHCIFNIYLGEIHRFSSYLCRYRDRFAQRKKDGRTDQIMIKDN